MAMTKKLGTTLAAGVTASGVTGLHEQSGNRNARGELKTYYDKDGNEISVYIFDDHKEFSWSALMESTVADKALGDPITVGTDQCYVTQWEVAEQNDDVKRVNIGCRTTTLTVAAQTTNAQTTNAQTPT
ncbi:MAG: hypothetical protein J6V72_20790 [Kiritimatiellae bacterium]|nr:hypothetical protein [Kiritimatiellia bacterium]